MRLSSEERRTRRLVEGRVQEIRGISLVFREMWDTTVLDPQLCRLSLGAYPDFLPLITGEEDNQVTGHRLSCHRLSGLTTMSVDP
jgi:hypothetical protein